MNLPIAGELPEGVFGSFEASLELEGEDLWVDSADCAVECRRSSGSTLVCVLSKFASIASWAFSSSKTFCSSFSFCLCAANLCCRCISCFCVRILSYMHSLQARCPLWHATESRATCRQRKQALNALKESRPRRCYPRIESVRKAFSFQLH